MGDGRGNGYSPEANFSGGPGTRDGNGRDTQTYGDGTAGLLDGNGEQNSVGYGDGVEN